MSCVHYKFSSKLNYDTVTFDGLHISLCDLKRQIMGREKLKAADCDLQITNAQTKEGACGRGAHPAGGGTGRPAAACSLWLVTAERESAGARLAGVPGTGRASGAGD